MCSGFSPRGAICSAAVRNSHGTGLDPTLAMPAADNLVRLAPCRLCLVGHSDTLGTSTTSTIETVVAITQHTTTPTVRRRFVPTGMDHLDDSALAKTLARANRAY